MKRGKLIFTLLLCIVAISSIKAHMYSIDIENEAVNIFADSAAMSVDIEAVDRSERPFPERAKPDPQKPYIALTFDDGPKLDTTNQILDCLERHGSTATFFVLGCQISKTTSPILKRMLELQCEIGNHSWDHPILPNLSKAQISSQISSTDNKIFEACGKYPVLIRPPYGSINSKVLNCISKPAILWSVDTLDWESRNTKKVVDYVLSTAKSGDIVLMHDIYRSTSDAVEPIVAALTSRGFQLVTVSELLMLRGDVVAAGNKYY